MTNSLLHMGDWSVRFATPGKLGQMNRRIKNLRIVFICMKQCQSVYAGECVGARSITVEKVYERHSRYHFDHSCNGGGDVLAVRTSSGLSIGWRYNCSHLIFIHSEIVQNIVSAVDPSAAPAWILTWPPNGWLKEICSPLRWGSCIRWLKNIYGRLSKCLINLVSALLIWWFDRKDVNRHLPKKLLFWYFLCCCWKLNPKSVCCLARGNPLTNLMGIRIFFELNFSKIFLEE